jgi:hypothetical protein
MFMVLARVTVEPAFLEHCDRGIASRAREFPYALFFTGNLAR